MKFEPEKIDDFARSYGFHYDGIDEDALTKDFCAEAVRGLNGEHSSLAMIPSYIYPVERAPENKTVLAIDAGGTNLRASLIHFNGEGRAEQHKTQRRAMPGTEGHLSAEQFFDGIAACAAPCLESSGSIDGIGFCFSYNMELSADGDAVPAVLSKELDVPEIVGKSLKEGLSAAFSRAGIKEQKRIVFLNDTTATLLSGIVQIPPMKPSKTEELKTREKLKLGGGDVIGFILGTGANTAHIESAIPKINFNDNKRPQIVVSESGAWAYGRRGKLDLEFDASTSQPNQYTLEKAASGAYLGNLSLHILKRAVLDGLLSFDKKNALLEMEKLETRNLNAFLHNPLAFEGVLGSLFSQNEVDAISTLLHIESIITERAALLSASLLAGTVLHTGAGRDPLRPLRIAVEGTTYLRYHHIRESLDARLETLLCKIHAPHYIIAPVEQASLQGAAVAALSTMGAAVAALSTTGGQAGQAGRA